MSRVLCDFHHSSLLRSLVLLFEERLDMALYRPIGMDWFDEGFWAINNQRDTAEQFLKPESQALDGTPEYDAGRERIQSLCGLSQSPARRSNERSDKSETL